MGEEVALVGGGGVYIYNKMSWWWWCRNHIYITSNTTDDNLGLLSSHIFTSTQNPSVVVGDDEELKLMVKCARARS